MDRGHWACDGNTLRQKKEVDRGNDGKGSEDEWTLSVPSILTSDWCTTW